MWWLVFVIPIVALFGWAAVHDYRARRSGRSSSVSGQSNEALNSRMDIDSIRSVPTAGVSMDWATHRSRDRH